MHYRISRRASRTNVALPSARRRCARSHRRLVAAALAIVVAAAAVPDPAAATTVSCQTHSVSVGLLVQMTGTLCTPAENAPDTVFVLVPGGTYNQTYWNFPYQPELYNFREAMNAAGYATMTVDRLGTGASSKPLGATVTALRQSAAVHMVVGALRAGTLGGTSFEKIVLGGHSLGSMISLMEAATYGDVDGVMITGMTHHMNPISTVMSVATFIPAPLDPALSARGLDLTYLTTMAGQRAIFHEPGQVDPAVLAVDEATKDVVASGEGDSYPIAAISPYSALIDVPVLIAMGAEETLFCGPPLGADCASPATLLADEAPYYAGSPCVQAFVLPGSGHDINLHPSAGAFHERAVTWLDDLFGVEAPQAPAGTCPPA